MKVHIPEFIHHNRHTKVITIHHHHHKPKKEHHHHHHHHHHKPHIPQGHYHHTHKKTHTILKGKETKYHGHKHGHHGHHGYHGHHGHHSHHGHDPHHDSPSYIYEPSSGGSYVPSSGSSYQPNAGGSFEGDYASYTPSVPHYSPTIPQVPRVKGIQHTEKHVKVFDSLPGVLPSTGKSHGYQVTEQDEEDEEGEDYFTPVNGIEQAYPGTYGFIRGLSADPIASHDPFAQLTPQSTVHSQSNDIFVAAPLPTSGLSEIETFTTNLQNSAVPSVQSRPEFPVNFQGNDGGFDNTANSFAGNSGGSNLLLNDDKLVSEDSPVSFQREAGIQQTITTAGVETLTY